MTNCLDCKHRVYKQNGEMKLCQWCYFKDTSIDTFSADRVSGQAEMQVIASEHTEGSLANGAVAEVLNKLVDSLKRLMKEKEQDLKDYKGYKYAKQKYILTKEAETLTVMGCIMFVQTALRDYIKEKQKGITHGNQNLSKLIIRQEENDCLQIDSKQS